MVARRVISALIFLVAALAFAGPFVVLDTADSSWGQRHTTISISGLDLILNTTPDIETEGDDRVGDSAIPGLAEAAADAPNSPAAMTDGNAARTWAIIALLLTLGAAALAAFRTNRGLGALAAIVAVPAAMSVSGSVMTIINKVEDTPAANDIFPGHEAGGGAWGAGLLLAFGAFFVFLDAMVTGHRPRPFVPANMRQAYPPPGYPQPGPPPSGYGPQQPFPQQQYPPQSFPQQPYPPQGAPAQQGYPAAQGYPAQGYPAQGDPAQQGYPPQAPPPQSAPPFPQSGPPYPQSGPPYPPQSPHSGQPQGGPPYPPQPPQPPYGAPYGT